MIELLKRSIFPALLKRAGDRLVGRKDLSAQAKRYVQTVFWLYHSVFSFRPWTTILTVGCNVVGVLLKGAALTTLVYIAHKLESGTPLSIEQLQITLQPRESEGFVILVLFTGLLLLVGGVVAFLANQWTVRLATNFALAQSRRVLALNAGCPSRNPDPSEGPYPQEINSRAKGVIVVVRAIRPLLQVFRPLLFLLISISALLYMAPFLTFILILVVLPSLLFQYLVNYTAAQNEKLLAKAQRKMQRTIISRLDALAWAPWVGQSEDQALSAAYSSENITEYPERFITRTMASPKSQAVSDMLITLLAVIIVISLGVAALKGQISWAMVAGYVVFSRMAMTSLRGLLGTITGFARHYPVVRKLYELLTSPPEESCLDLPGLRIRRSSRTSPGDLRSLRLKRGECLGVVSPVPCTRYNSYAWADALASARNVHRNELWGTMICIPDARRKRPGGSLRELLVLDPEVSAKEVLKAAAELNPESEDDMSHIDVDAPLAARTWHSLLEAMRCRLLLAFGAQAHKDILLVEHQVLNCAHPDFVTSWWRQVSDRFVIVRHKGTNTLGRWGEKAYLAMRTDRARALMSSSWIEQNRPALKEWLAQAEERESEDELSLMDDDDD